MKPEEKDIEQREIFTPDSLSLREEDKGKVIEGVVPKLMRKYDNLYGDLSAGSGCNAIKRDEEYGIKFLNEFQDRLMFGIDTYSTPDDPPPFMVYLKQLLAEKKISQELFDKISHGNAIRILNL